MGEFFYLTIWVLWKEIGLIILVVLCPFKVISVFSLLLKPPSFKNGKYELRDECY